MSEEPNNEPDARSHTSDDDHSERHEEDHPDPDFKAVRRVATQFETDTAVVTARLYDAWKAACDLTATPAGVASVDDSLDVFAKLVRGLYYDFNAWAKGEKYPSNLECWSRMYDAGFPDLVQDIIMHDKFWLLSRPDTIETLLKLQLAIAIHTDRSYQSFIPRLLSRSDALWAAMWRSRILITNSITVGFATPSERDHPSVMLLLMHYHLHELNNSPVPLGSYMWRYSLYAWTTIATFPSQNFKRVFLCDPGVRGSSYDPVIFTREPIGDIDTHACMSRLADVLRGEDQWHWNSIADLQGSLSFFSNLMIQCHADEAMAFAISASQHRIPHLVAVIAKKHALAGGLRANPVVYSSTFSLVLRTSEYDWNTDRSTNPRQSPLVPGEDVVTILSCAIDTLAVHGSESCQSEEEHIAFGTVKDVLMGSMKIYYDWAKDIMRKEPGTITALEANLLSGLRRGAEEHWWPSLRTLNTAKRRCEARNEDFVKFGTLWKGFGALLGCDIRRERERDALDAAGRCTRLECEYHRTPTGQQLLRCKGCGVYYCSRECQVADWKSGHKKACGRRIRDGEAD